MEALLVLTTEDSRMFRPELLSTSTLTLILTTVFESFYKRFSCAVFPYLYWRYLDST